MALGSLFVPAIAAADTVTLAPSADTYIYANAPAQSYGGAETFAVRFRSATDYAKALLRFSFDGIPASSTIQSATLTLTPQAMSIAQTTTVDADRVTAAWEENAATWSSAPAVGERIDSTALNSGADHVFDLTTAVQKWVSGEWANDGLRLSGPEGVGGNYSFLYWSREASNEAYRPSLAVTYVPAAPPVPEQLTLSNISVATAATAATVSFQTNKNATGTVEYGVTDAYGASKTQTDEAWILHTITLGSLTPDTVYHYRVAATAEGGLTAASADLTFTTAATTPGAVAAGTLVKTAESAAVYYVGADGKRHAFPNEKIYRSWYADFSSVQTISADVMASLPLGANVTYRPGVRMVKFQTLPKVYAIARGGELRWVQTEALATALYGTGWQTAIDDLSDAFVANYRFGADIATAADYSPSAATAETTTIDQNW